MASKPDNVRELRSIMPDDCIGIIISFISMVFRGTCTKYMKMIENPARLQIDYLQAMKIRPSLLSLRLYFGKQKLYYENVSHFTIRDFSRKTKNCCWASTNRKGLRCNRHCIGRLCWQHKNVISQPVLAAPRFTSKSLCVGDITKGVLTLVECVPKHPY